MTLPKRIIYWKYKRRAHRIGLLMKMLGKDFGIEYGRRRGWINENGTHGDQVQLRRTGKWLR